MLRRICCFLSEIRSMKPIATVLLAIGLFLPCIAGCSRSYLFEGVVVDGQGVGIIGADVIVYPYDQERSRSGNGVKTGANGKFEVGWGSIPGVKFFKMEVSKAGFDVDKRLVLEDEQGIRIVLSVAGSKVE
jgi:hypothetical protein